MGVFFFWPIWTESRGKDDDREDHPMAILPSATPGQPTHRWSILDRTGTPPTRTTGSETTFHGLLFLRRLLFRRPAARRA